MFLMQETGTRYNCMIHDFGLLNALRDEPAVKAAMIQAGTALQAYLN